MRAPKIPSFFRNVKNDHRRFRFKSAYYKPKDEELEKRKRKIEAELAREQGEKATEPPPVIRFDRRRGNRRRRQGYMAMLRTGIILVVLIYLLYKGIQWAEQTDFGKVLKIIENG